MSNHTTTHEYAKLFATLTDQNVFLTGKAGTGKTTFLRKLKETSLKQMAVVAPTGVAAINAGGTTIHSFFQLPLTPFIPTELGRKELIGKMRMHSRKRRVLRELELLVIDEISMVRADILDAIDTVLRSVRYRHNEPFGGVQMIFIGDMYQLSPVAQQDEWQILSKFYKGVYFFNSLVFKEKPFIHIEFEKIFRQKDIEFIRVLNEVRNNQLSTASKALLDSRYNPLFKAPKDDTYIILTTHNYKADRINREELNNIKKPSKFFEAKISREFPERIYPVEENLELKIGAKVMFVKNDTDIAKRFFNGKIGTVTSWNEDAIFVQCPEDEEEIEVTPMIWENIRYETNESTLEVIPEVIGTFTQFPLRLAWAITIHKSQGLTFDKAIIDAEMAFAPGQVYVALSRCRSLEGLVLQSRISETAIQNADEIVRFSGGHFTPEQLESSYAVSRNQYYLSLLKDVFNFQQMVSLSSRWITTTNEVASSFSSETLDFLREISKQVNTIQDVGVKFGVQITQIVNQVPFNEELLNLRLDASEKYFSEKLESLIDTLKNSPAVTDSRENALDFDDYFMDVYTFAEQKLHWIKGIKNGFSVEKYFQLRKSFVLPPINITAYSRKQSKTKISSRHPELLSMLFDLRNFIADETGMPIYLIANAKTLMEMADYLPLNKADMLKISGIGELKYERFGAQFLEVIRDYCDENDIETAMNELFDRDAKEKKERKPKRVKGDSARETLEVFQGGMPIKEIAKVRRLTETTIAKHLAEFVVKGDLDAEKIVSKENLLKAKNLIEENAEYDGSLYSLLKEHFDASELSIIIAWLRTEQ